VLNRCLHAMRRETAAKALTEPGRSPTPAAPTTKLSNRGARSGSGNRFLTKSRVFPMLSIGMIPRRDSGAGHRDRSDKQRQ
jgi:hypothetical protein